MFPDSQVAKSFQLSKTKCAYYIVFGLTPYFKELLVKDIKLSPFYLLSFDEYLNNKLQEEQMDISVWFWDDITGETVTRCFDSRFFKRQNADNILEELLKATTNLPTKSLSMLSMDGPNTNWSVHKKLKNIRSCEKVPQLFEVGSCGLHVIHGAFQSGVKTTGWEIEKNFKGMWRLFHDSPARRDTYITINRSDQFPLMFCQTRWVEDVPVATRALEIWSFVVAVVEHFQALPSSRQPLNNKSYISVKHHKNNSIIFKFHQLMKMFLLRSIVNDVVTSDQLVKLDITKKEGFLPQLAVKLPTASKALLSTLEIISSKKLNLIDQCVSMVETILFKLQERCPLKYLIVCCSSCLVPRSIVNESESIILHFNKVVDKLFKHQQLNNKEADEAKLQFEELPIMFYDIQISLTVLMYPCNIWINFIVNFFTKISITNQHGKFLFSLLPCHMGKAKLKEVLA